MKKRAKLSKNMLIGAVVILLILIITIFLTTKPAAIQDIVENNQLIGGQRDEHGCLGAAGYTFNEGLDICVREWELEGETQMEAIIIATRFLKETRQDTHGLTYVSIDVNDCEGCFTVHYDMLGEQIPVTMIDWNVP